MITCVHHYLDLRKSKWKSLSLGFLKLQILYNWKSEMGSGEDYQDKKWELLTSNFAFFVLNHIPLWSRRFEKTSTVKFLMWAAQTEKYGTLWNCMQVHETADCDCSDLENFIFIIDKTLTWPILINRPPEEKPAPSSPRHLLDKHYLMMFNLDTLNLVRAIDW